MNVCSVLIVENHLLQHQYVGYIFQATGGFELQLVCDATSALNHLSHKRYDLVLTDLMMTRMNGLKLIQHISKLRRPPALALLNAASRRMLVGSAQVGKYQGLQIVGLVSKPLREDEIIGLHSSLDLSVAKQMWGASKQIRGCRSHATLIKALVNEKIQAWFQPKESLRGAIVAPEALACWVHPTEGVLMLADFMNDIEKIHLKIELLGSMLAQTLYAQAEWAKMGYQLPVSINLPTHLLNRIDLVDNLLGQVVASQGDSRKITFKLTENSTTPFSSNCYAGACRFRPMGFDLEQDDFGKGYSSYSYLASTPFTELQIDRSLVLGCGDDKGSEAVPLIIVDFGRTLDLITVAEGAGTQSELAVLRRKQCDLVQGFIISPAVGMDDLAALLKIDGLRSAPL